MIRQIHLKSGQSPQSAPLSFEPTPLTIFVGPNNSGKSLLLREIEDFCSHGQKRDSFCVLNNLEFEPLPIDQVGPIMESLREWLSHLQIEGGKPTWLVRMFEAMGDNPESGNYLRPGEGDVWGFVGEIKEWLFYPSRSGIPGE